MITDYALKPPSHDELRSVFGSLTKACRATGGDLPLICFYLHNTDRIPVDDLAGGMPWSRVALRADETAFARDLAKAARDESDRALAVVAHAIYLDKRSLTAVMAECHASADRVMRVLGMPYDATAADLKRHYDIHFPCAAQAQPETTEA